MENLIFCLICLKLQVHEKVRLMQTLSLCFKLQIAFSKFNIFPHKLVVMECM